MNLTTREVFLAGRWRPADMVSTFRALCPLTGKPIGDQYPVSSRADVDAALEAGAKAAEELGNHPASTRADFLEAYAARIEKRAEEIVELAHAETALPASPRLGDVELPRTTGQLRQAASAARSGDWTLPTIDTAANIRSMFGPLGGPVVMFGPNNFPLAFNSISGGDFSTAIAAGNPVIAKAHPNHPGTTRLLGEEAAAALEEAGLPAATMQLLYGMDYEDGYYLVSHRIVGATAYTGSRAGGLALKAAADAAGKPIYLELSSINPVFILNGALRERLDGIVDEFVTSMLMGTGQFCTNPGVVVMVRSDETERFVARVREKLTSLEPGPLLSSGVAQQLGESVEALIASGAELVTGGSALKREGCFFENTLLRVAGEVFLSHQDSFQREAFGNSSLIVVADDGKEADAIAAVFEGNLTGAIYTDTGGEDDELYGRLASRLRKRVGRLLNDKMPTGVAVTAAMNHGGPFPATGHPGFTSVGIPASLRRFAMLECYDNLREPRLPLELRNCNPNGKLWRWIDGNWTQGGR